MAKDAHNKAAEQHENAAKAHRTAAEHHGKGDHAAGKKHATTALEHSGKAHEASKAANEKSGYLRYKPEEGFPMEHECSACGGSGVCHNKFHDAGVINDIITDASGDKCPACGQVTGDPGNCSVCGATGMPND